MLSEASTFTVPLVTAMLCTPPVRAVPSMALMLMASPSRSMSLASRIAFRAGGAALGAVEHAGSSTASGASLTALMVPLTVALSVRLPSLMV